jgi:hypothetical protein
MRVRRLLAIGAVVLLAGCSPAAGGGAKPSAAPKTPVVIPSDPVAAFAAAKAQLGRESARFATQDGTNRVASYTGVVNAQTKNWEVTGEEYDVRRVGTDIYLKMSGSVLDNALVQPATHDQLAAGRWVRTRMPGGREVGGVVFNDAFPWNLANPAVNAKSLKRTGPRTFAGVLTIKDSRPVPTRPDIAAPVTVDLDDQGRFARISLNVEPEKKSSPPAVFTFTDLGLPADITAPPAADVLADDDPTILISTGLN